VFWINGTLAIPGNVTLRGAGPTQTTLDLQGWGSAAVRVRVRDERQLDRVDDDHRRREHRLDDHHGR